MPGERLPNAYAEFLRPLHEPAAPAPERKYKILLAGEPQTGKTLIAEQTDACFPFKPYGVSIGKISRYVEQHQKSVTLILWTLTLGRPKSTTYFRGARAAIVVGNLARRETVLKMRDWAETIEDYFEFLPIFFIGTMDESASLVNIETMKRIAADYEGLHFVIRGEDPVAFESVFDRLAKLLLDRKIEESPEEPFGTTEFTF